MKNLTIICFFAAMVFGAVIMSGCINDGSTDVTSTPVPTRSIYPGPATISGHGASVTTLDLHKGGCIMHGKAISYTKSDEELFTAEITDADGRAADEIVSRGHLFNKSTPFEGLKVGICAEGKYRVSVKGDADWSITVEYN